MCYARATVSFLSKPSHFVPKSEQRKAVIFLLPPLFVISHLSFTPSSHQEEKMTGGSCRLRLTRMEMTLQHSWLIIAEGVYGVCRSVSEYCRVV